MLLSLFTRGYLRIRSGRLGTETLRSPAPAAHLPRTGHLRGGFDGRQPKGLRLAEMLGNGPLAWNKQRSVWLPPGALRRRPAWNPSRTARGPAREIEWLVSAGNGAALACPEGTWIRCIGAGRRAICSTKPRPSVGVGTGCGPGFARGQPRTTATVDQASVEEQHRPRWPPPSGDCRLAR
jgi:hypothetical protein